MKIRKAIIESKKQGRGITRKSFSRSLWIIPTSTTEGMIVVSDDDLTARWEPSARDLIADDWIVYG